MKQHTSRRSLAMLLAILTVLGLAYRNARPHSHEFQPRVPERGPDTAFYQEGFLPIHPDTPTVHSAVLAETAEQTIRSIWYGGSREGAGDVELYTACYKSTSGEWTAPESVISPRQLERQVHRHIAKLGNPALLSDQQGNMWLFFVSVSVGGWSGSSVNLTQSADDGVSWTPATRLITSPFFNISTLVKCAPYFYADGTIGLPMYHECLGKFAERLHLDREGNVLDKQRLSHGRHSLQPVIIPKDSQNAIALMRYKGDPPNRVLQSVTTDSEAAWSTPERSSLPNPDAAVSGVLAHDNSLLVVFNDSEKSRKNLSLARSTDFGKTWRVVHVLEEATPLNAAGSKFTELSYPCLISTTEGDYHLVYTWYRKKIKHIIFNAAWLEALPGWTSND